MNPFDDLSESRLARLNLRRQGDDLAIVWPADTNIYHLTLGRHLGTGARDLAAVTFEAADGTVTRQSFAEVERAASGLAARLRGLGYGRGDLVVIHTGQHPDTAVAHMAVCKARRHGGHAIPALWSRHTGACRGGLRCQGSF
ncbi:hypothetical protein PSQ19_01265 [Devosia algicola]|uniref:AMP-dependent synthetase/ligase domain-containing protein n=1 Tax=Devosia algicola TaxID=3026418 RepID=A0ABY7YNJ8_9HYPH|nr:AMP-binding protein [Devosia algicola]WDR02886.1 hypothetical protein PSQ19_01265 [Devosia algicola]